jgi:hypothetical protein
VSTSPLPAGFASAMTLLTSVMDENTSHL